MRRVTYDDYGDRIGAVLRFLHERLDERIEVATLAGVGCMSPFHFQRVFRRMTGENAIEMVRRLRMERAAWRLQGTPDRVTAIALDAGYDSLEAFTRAFSTAFGAPPSAFRERGWMGYWIPSPIGLHYSPDGDRPFRLLAPRGESIPVEMREVPQTRVVGMWHQGPLQFVANTWVEFVEVLKKRGVDFNAHPLTTHAPALDAGIPMSEIRAHVGVPAGLVPVEPGLTEEAIGGGRHLVARHVGSGHLLGDFWLRVWAEALPAAGAQVRPGPCFQIYPHGLFASNPDAFVTDVYIPIAESRIFDQAAQTSNR